jgi:chemotaxis protein MotB
MQDETKLWMIPYADLMSTMVILFLALFAMSYSGSPESAQLLAKIESSMASDSQAKRAQERLEETEIAVRIQDTLGALALRDFGVTVDSRYVRLRLPAPVLFGEGSAALNPGAEPILSALAKLFGSIGNPVLVEGYTDDVPIAGGHLRSNYELSAARALSVVRFFIDRGDMAPERFFVRGYSEYRPIASNSTAQGRQINRRIEISLIREISKEKPASPAPAAAVGGSTSP